MTPKRVRLLAYICGNNCIRWRCSEGLMLFRDVFTLRPDDCRYAVVEVQGRIWAIDLYEVLVGALASDIEIGQYREFDDIDTAIAATMLTY